ncbi:MAG: hypothetical protein CMO99_01400 [Woeseiaceae bacterium]|nr:hypothetical protein [Woeseiaceae bacterium]|tara:strand:- start:2 stop:277 length:276 start_codon:yes stop_codon:yes gene_type:complete
MKNSEEKKQLIEFPCDFSIKVIGKDCPDFLNSVSEIMRSHSQVYSEKNVKKNKSKKGNYISITCDVYVTSQNELDKIYIDLSKNKNILFVL